MKFIRSVITLCALALPFGALAQAGDGTPISTFDTTLRQVEVHVPRFDATYTASSTLTSALAAGAQTSLGASTSGVFVTHTLTASLAALPHRQRVAVTMWRAVGNGNTTCDSVTFEGVRWDGVAYREVVRNQTFVAGLTGTFLLTREALQSLYRVQAAGCVTTNGLAQQFRVLQTDWIGLPFKIQRIADLQKVCRRALGGSQAQRGHAICVEHRVSGAGVSQWQTAPQLSGNAIRFPSPAAIGPAGGFQQVLTENDEVLLDFVASRQSR
jgi:hypothetical protein